MKRRCLTVALILSSAFLVASSFPAAAQNQLDAPTVTILASGLDGASGSAIGPDGALYVTEGAAGRISRIDPQTGDKTIFASGLPTRIIPLGGAIDIAFIDRTAYVLVTLVGFDLGGMNPVGIYRVDNEDSFTVIADVGEFSLNNPPDTSFEVPTGLQFAMEHFRGGLLVTDGHHNRLLYVSLEGDVSELMTFDNIVPTGLEVHGNTIYMAEAGPNPHLPQSGKVVAFGPASTVVTEVASGAPLLVDVEYGLGQRLFALSQGVFEEGLPDAAPAMPNTGSLVKLNGDGSFTVIVDGLNQPTSLEFIGNTAYVVSLAGDVYKITNVAEPPYGRE